MIWLRRAIAVLLAIVFLMIYAPVLVVFRANDTLLNSAFYTDELRRADVYNFLYDELLPTALAESDIRSSAGNSTFLDVIRPEIAPILKETFPPEWLQTEVERSLDAAMPYFTGDSETLRIVIPLKERVPAGMAAIKKTLHKPGVFPALYSDFSNQVIEQAATGAGDLPLSQNDLRKIITTLAPESWCLAQADLSIDEITPYLSGDKDHFNVTLVVSGQVEGIEPVAVEILTRPATYDYVFNNLVLTAVKQKAQSLNLPMGVVLSDSDIIQTARTVFPASWYSVQVTGATKQVIAYIKGTSPALAVSVPLADRKPLTVSTLVALVNQKLGMNVSAVSTPLITVAVNGLIPDQVTITEAMVNDLMGTTAADSPLLKARNWVQKGITFSDTDLMESLGPDSAGFEEVRQRIKGGFSFTESDLRNAISGGNVNSPDLIEFDRVRQLIATVRQSVILVGLFALVLLIGIGLLGGKSWGGKLIWTGVTLGIASLGAYIIFGPVYSALVGPQMDTALRSAVGAGTALDVAGTTIGTRLMQNIIGSFFGGLKTWSLIYLAIGVALTVGGFVWYSRRDKTGNPREEITINSPGASQP